MLQLSISLSLIAFLIVFLLYILTCIMNIAYIFIYSKSMLRPLGMAGIFHKGTWTLVFVWQNCLANRFEIPLYDKSPCMRRLSPSPATATPFLELYALFWY